MSVDYLTLFRDCEKINTHQEGTAQTEEINLHSLCSSPVVHKNVFISRPPEAASSKPAMAADHDRRYCTECRNLSQAGVCRIAKPQIGALVVARRGYCPSLDMLIRCKGFAELAGFNSG